MAFIDKNEMKDPYFSVRIGPPGGQPDQMVTLPTWVHQLIYSFEYSETINGGEDSAARIKLLFYETLNRPGSVLDLKIKDGNIIFKEPKQVKEGTKQASTSIANKPVASNQAKESGSKQSADTKAKSEKEAEKKLPSVFLLQERNTIEVTWGYRSAKNALLQPRTVRAEILQITHRASGEDIASTEVSAVDIGTGEFSKVFPKEGIDFTIKKVKELLSGALKDSRAADKANDDKPARIDDIATAIATALLKDTEVNVQLADSDLKIDIQDDISGRRWSTGTNLHDFLKDLAEKIFAHYYMSTTVKNGKVKAVLNIVSRRKHEGSTRFHFMWMSGLAAAGINSNKGTSLVFNTLKDYDMQLYPVGGSGGSSTGVCSEEKQVVGSSANYEGIFRPKGAEPVGSIQFVKVQQVKTTGDTAEKVDATGAPVYSASCSEESHIAKANRLAGRMEANLRLSFNSIGIPRLKPEVIFMSNIGQRYSGLYYLLSVTHTITAESGYVCAAVGESNSIASGGVDVGGNPAVKEPAPDQVQLAFRAEPGKSKKAILDTATVLKKK